LPDIETFDNPRPGRDYAIRHVAPEFTSVCPKTGQPDFGAIEIEYVADRLCAELKSLKLYLQGFRNTGVFYEDVVNRILDDLVAAVRPRRMTVTGSFTPRGGIHSIVTATYERPARTTARRKGRKGRRA
jgi:7-cyano-7-deazaguanine reductase